MKEYTRPAFIDPITGEKKTRVTRYWSPDEETCYTLEQVETMKKDNPSSVSNFKPIYYTDWKTLVESSNSQQKLIKNNSETNMPILVDPPQPTEEEIAIEANKKEIEDAKDYLNRTDYAVIKCLEKGLDLDTEYPGLRDLRQQARDKVNAAEAQIQSLSV